MTKRWWLSFSNSGTRQFLGVVIARGSSARQAIISAYENKCLVDGDCFAQEIPDWVSIPESFEGRVLRWNDCVAIGEPSQKDVALN